MGLSVRAFGLSAGSLLLPQALMGVATVGILFATVRRWCGPAAGLLAALVMAVTPVAVLIFRFDDPDALLTPLLFLLVLITGAGTGVGVLIVGVALIQAPAISRIVRTATQVEAVRGYVEAAIARGERSLVVVSREILPNILAPVLADAGPRFTFSILIIAAVNFLGLGLQPPSPDWALMISENRACITINRGPVVAPAAMIALLTIGINLTADAHRALASAARSCRAGAVRAVSAIAPSGRRRVDELRVALGAGEPVVEDVSFERRRRRDPRPRRRVGQRQDDGRAGAARLHAARASIGRGGTVEVGGRADRAAATSASCARCAGASCPTCRRIRAARSTRRCASATRSSTCCGRTRRRRARDESVHRARARRACRRPRASPRRYPHQLSGGQQQRRDDRDGAACCDPPVAVLDEPTTGLDVLTQDRILAELDAAAARERHGDGLCHRTTSPSSRDGRPHRRHVRRADRRERPRREVIERAAPPVHAARSSRRSPTSVDPRRCAASRASPSASAMARRLRLRAPLRARAAAPATRRCPALADAAPGHAVRCCAG